MWSLMRGAWLGVACAMLLAASAAEAQGPAGKSAGAKVHKFGGPAKCRSCHGKDAIGNQYAAWLKTGHAKAWDTLATEQAKTWAAEAGIADPQQDERCFQCHVTGHGAPAAVLGLQYRKEDGVTCEACHGPGMDYRKKKIMMDRDLAVANGLVLQSEKVCTTCHNDKSPAWDPERYTLPGGGKTGFDYEQAVKAIAHPVPEGYDPMSEGEAD